MANSNLLLTILAVDKASGTLSKIGSKMGGLSKLAGPLAGAFSAAAVVKFGKDSVASFENTAKSAGSLQRQIGGSVEDASRLGHALRMSGIDANTAGVGMRNLSKHLAANDKSAKALGISFRDTQGKVKPMNELLPKIAEKFKSMPAGAEKTALAMKLFGRNGLSMLPFLNKGAAGIKALAAESDKMGTTIGGKDLEAVKNITIQKRKMGEAVKGLQITIGKALYPIITKITEYFTSRFIPAFENAVKWIKENKDKLLPLQKAFENLGKFISNIVVPAIVGFGKWLVKYQGWLIPLAAGVMAIVVAFKIWTTTIRIIAAVTRVWTAVQAAFNVVMAMNPIGLIIVAVIGLIAIFVVAYKRSQTFRNIVDGAFKGIKKVVMSVIGFIKPFITTAFSYLKTIFTVYFNIYRAVFKTAFAVIKTVVVTTFNVIKRVVSTVFNAVKTVFTVYFNIYKTIVTGVIRTIRAVWNAGFNFFKTKVVTIFNGIKTTISNALSTVWGFITGLKDKITGIGSTLWEGLKSGMTAVIGFLRDKLNGLIGLFNKPIEFFNNNNGPLPDIPLIPEIPALARGGIVTSPTLALIGEAGPEAVIPLNAATGGMGGMTIIVNTGQSVSSKDDIAREIRKVMREAAQRGAIPSAWNVA